MSSYFIFKSLDVWSCLIFTRTHIFSTPFLDIKDSDIGIIAPYHKQVRKFQSMIHNKGWRDIKAGTTENFQGDERKVVIVSTVRSKEVDRLKDDRKVRSEYHHT